MHSWAPSGRPLRLEEQTQDADDDDPKALSCYGLSCYGLSCYGLSCYGVYFPHADATKDMLLRFVKERPVSSMIANG